MDDLISREAAIKESYQIVIDGEKYDVVQVETLMGLPAAKSKIHDRLHPKADKNFSSCLDCVHSEDSEAVCKMRGCIHAIYELKECYKDRKNRRI